MKEAVRMQEVGLRDGLQSIDTFIPTAAKKAWITAEHDAGVSNIEVSSMVPPSYLPQFADAEEVIAHALTLPGLTVGVLVPNLKGALRAMACHAHKLNYVISASEGHNRANVRRRTEDSIADFARIVEARKACSSYRPMLTAGVATAFGCTIDGDIQEERVVNLAVRLAEEGADEIFIADTVGYANPAMVDRRCRAVSKAIAPIPMGLHLHDTRGLGLANAHAALMAGVRILDASLAGLGGCPFAPGATGNIVMEDAVFMVEEMGFSTGIDLGRLLAVRSILAQALPDQKLLGHIAVAGLPRRSPADTAQAVS